MDDFQHRLLVALERLSGREGATPAEALGSRLDELDAQFSALLMVLEEIRDRLPPAGP